MEVFSIVLSAAAVLIAGWAAWDAHRTRKRQPELIEEQIRHYEEARAAQARASIRLEFHRRPPGPQGVGIPHRIFVYNDGPAEARDINLQFPGQSSPLDENDANQVLPIPVLAPGPPIPLTVKLGGRQKAAPPFHVVVTWKDPGNIPRQTETTLHG